MANPFDDDSVVSLVKAREIMQMNFVPFADLLNKFPDNANIHDPKTGILFRVIPEPLEVRGKNMQSARVRSAGVHWIREKKRIVCAGDKELIFAKQMDPEGCPACKYAITSGEVRAKMMLKHFFVGVNISAYKKKLNEWLKKFEASEIEPNEDDFPLVLTLLECGPALANKIMDLHVNPAYGEVMLDDGVGILDRVPFRIFKISTGNQPQNVKYEVVPEREPGSKEPAWPVPALKAIQGFNVGIKFDDGTVHRSPNIDSQIKAASPERIRQWISDAIREDTQDKEEHADSGNRQFATRTWNKGDTSDF